ncbi:hypothetical protein DY000_02045317 [Brassica cretica]|uniref:Uncharacterized protein n=1 Tax=Brassica cretica TaxID=69181 RepID=A0ABQ7F6F2_BRACR|nr:hypothetical protein DY000_02045317 [Brassica cretica]
MVSVEHRLVYGLASVVFDVALLGLSTDLADLVSSGGGFSECFPSGIVGAGECVTPVSEGSVDRAAIGCGVLGARSGGYRVAIKDQQR